MIFTVKRRRHVDTYWPDITAALAHARAVGGAEVWKGDVRMSIHGPTSKTGLERQIAAIESRARRSRGSVDP